MAKLNDRRCIMIAANRTCTGVAVLIIACLLHTAIVSAQEGARGAEGDLPRVSDLLNQASVQIGSLDPGSGQAYLYRRLAALFARSQDVEAAYRELEKIQVPKAAYPNAAENQKRVGFIDMVGDVTLYRDTQSAIDIVNKSPDAYRAYRDDAFGQIALSASQRRDSEGAWNAIAAIKEPKGLYPYELVVAATLDDKSRGKRLLLEMHRDTVSAIEGRKLMAREEWAGILWMLAFYKWCGLTDESEQLLSVACQTTSHPEAARAEALEHLASTTMTEADEPSKSTAKNRPSRNDIAQMASSVVELRTPEQKAKRLVEVAILVLEFGVPRIAPDCD